MGLRLRLLLIVVVGLGLSLVTSLVLLVQMERRAQARDAAERAGAMLQTLSVPSALLLTQGRLADLDNLLSEMHRRREALDLEQIVLVDHEGVVLAHSESERYGVNLAAEDPFVHAAVQAQSPVVERDGGRPVRVAVPVQTGIRWATLIGTLSEEALERRVAEREKRLVLSAVTVSAIGLVLLLLFLSTAVVVPIRQLSRAAHRFAEGDLSARAPVKGKGEIAILGSALNTAAERLSHYTTELEEEVRRRTEELRATNEELQRANERLETLAITDGLTGLYNHRHFQQLLAMEITRQRRSRRPFSLLMFDVDHFKQYNDTHGHPAGDEVLRQVARLLRENTRAGDVVARYGGEEFVVLLFDTPLEAALAIAEKLRAAVAEHPFPHREQQPLGRLSVSVGVAAWPEHGEGAMELVAAADRALYRSKRKGRDQVSVAARANDVGGEA